MVDLMTKRFKTVPRPVHRPTRLRLKAGWLGLMAVALAGCQDLVANPAGEEAAALTKSEHPRGPITSMSIRVGDDLFMIPSGPDDDGCEIFKPYSVHNPVKAAIHYRQADGSFGIARDPKVCRTEMKSIGPDEEGCERYRAVPINADLPPLAHQIVYYQASDGGYSARKPKDSCS